MKACQQCSLVALDDRIAVSWKHDKRHFTVVGFHDVAELTDLMAWFDERKQIITQSNQSALDHFPLISTFRPGEAITAQMLTFRFFSAEP